MIASMEIKPPRAVQIRRLRDTGLSAEDIVKLTGYSRSVVAEALAVKRPIKK